MIRLSAFFVVAQLASASFGQTVTVDVTIEQVKAESRGITVSYPVGAEKKTTTLDVGRRAEITLNGKTVQLESIRPGQKATVEFHKELGVVTRITATGQTLATPKLVELTELGGMYPSLTEDGLTVVWEDKATIWTAHRADSDSYFTDKKKLFDGRHPALSSDGLEIVFLMSPRGTEPPTLHSATRDNTDGPFKRAEEIVVLRKQSNPKNPFLSADGLGLCFNRGTDNSNIEIVVSARRTRQDAWDAPERLAISSDSIQGILTFPCLTPDGLTMLCTNEGTPNLKGGRPMAWTRASAAEPFGNPKYVQIEGVPPLVGRSPRYVPATNELFLTGAAMAIVVVKNFTLAKPAD
jgi:hypothetical protein